MYKRILLAALVAAMTLAPRAARAVVTNQNSPVSYACTGTAGAKTFTITFPYLSYTHFTVTMTNAQGVITTLTPTTDYTIAPTSSGTVGTLTLVPDGTKCPAGSVLKITRVVPNTQTLSLSTQGPYSPKAIEGALDSLEMQVQGVNSTAQSNKTNLDLLLSGGLTTQPLVWTLAPDGILTSFTINGAAVTLPELYQVTIDGVVQKPTTDYTVNVAAQRITFTAAPAVNASVVVRTLGYAKSVTVDETTQPGAGSRTPFISLKGAPYFCLGNASDETICVQSAITDAQATAKSLYVPAGTFVASSLTITGSLTIFGEGTLRQKASTTGDFITISGTSTVVKISGVTFDGNEANQAFENLNRTINFTAVGTATAPAGLDVRGCSFINGNWTDIRFHGDANLATVEWLRVIGNSFFGGREGTSEAYGPRYLDISEAGDYVVALNNLHRLTAPVLYGRGGVVAYDGFGTGVEASGSIIGNRFALVGRSQVNSTLGAIDVYSRGSAVAAVGNTITTPYGRGIAIKAESKAVTITGNVINGLSGGSDGTMAAQITLNASTVAEANGPFTICGNSLYNSGNDGVSATLTDLNGTLYAKAIVICSNTIRDPVRRGIGVPAGAEVAVVGNIIFGGAIAIYADAVTSLLAVTNNQIKNPTGNAINITSANTTAWIKVADNQVIGGTRCALIASGAGGTASDNLCTGQSTSAFDIAGITPGPMRITGNVSNDATPFVNSGSNTGLHLQGNDWTMSTAAHTLTISSGVITATMDWHYVDGAATDTLTNILGGYDGQILTLRPANAAHVITVQNNSNMRLPADFVMDDTRDSITLRWANDAWIEMSRMSFSTGSGITYPTVIKAPVTFTGRTADLAAQNLTSSAIAGDYRVCVNARTTTSGTGTTATLNIIWTDEGGVKTDVVGTWALNSVTVTGQINKCEFIHAAAATAIQYSVTAGTYGTSVYAVSGMAERVN